MSHGEAGRNHNITQSLTAQQVSKHLAQTNRLPLFDGRAWEQRGRSPKAFRHLLGSEKLSHHHPGAEVWPDVGSPSCLSHFHSVHTTLMPSTRGSVIALPLCGVKTLKTFIHLPACDHYQHFLYPLREVAGNALVPTASCPSHITWPLLWCTAVLLCTIPWSLRLCCSLFLIRAQIASLRADL